MANKQLFKTQPGRLPPATDAINEAGGVAYALSPKAALAQYAATGCLNTTYYANADMQLDTVLALCVAVEPAFVAKTAIYARRRGQMKDMPALLTAWLAQHSPEFLEPTFARIVDNGRMLRNVVQILRSGVVGRKSLGSRPKRLVQHWLAGRSDAQLLSASVGNDPSLADVLKMVHPKPATPERAAFYAWLIGKPHDAAMLPEVVKALDRFRDDAEAPIPDVPFELLTAPPLRPQHWVAIACQAPWQMTRMNLNTFARHEVFKVGGMAQRIAERLRDPVAIRRARVFPYQLLSAYTMTGEGVPEIVRDALQDALEVALENVPELPGQVYVLLDVSGSMASPITGHRKGATSKVRCVDVAALVAAALSAKNPATKILPFDTEVHVVPLNRRDSVLTQAKTLAAFCGGGTNCGRPLATLNQRKAAGDLVIYVSDNESWADPQRGRGTETMKQWETFRQHNPKARLVCIDLQPYGTTQAQTRDDVLNVGGFSDAVFEVLARFAAGQLGGDHWVREIEAVEV
ncbi:MAG: RNA-binding protein [Candidatus Contendobacter sp.]|jgi:60 kDa SS-A/Ro ribonucleoprotein|nr:RNA-binding protein [Gammaproteobacteria bacterium]MCC8995439.1 RNA-binding protein [Candidatus Contendobacter sp.]